MGVGGGGGGGWNMKQNWLTAGVLNQNQNTENVARNISFYQTIQNVHIFKVNLVFKQKTDNVEMMWGMKFKLHIYTYPLVSAELLFFVLFLEGRSLFFDTSGHHHWVDLFRYYV